MAFDEALAERVRHLVGTFDKATEKKMFGGLSFLIAGNMAAGILGSDLIVRIGEVATEKALKAKGVKPFDFTGRVSKTMVKVGPEVLKTEAQLKKWIEPALAFAKSLPPK